MDVPVPSFSTCAIATAELGEEIMALARDAAGRTWFHVRGPRGPTGGCRVRATSSGAHRRESPPAQGGIQILGTGDVSATMPDKFQHSSPNSGWCLSSVH